MRDVETRIEKVIVRILYNVFIFLGRATELVMLLQMNLFVSHIRKPT